MSDPLPIVLASVAGVLLGAFFFGGLWWTVRKGTASDRPALWFFGSLVLRMSVVMPGFYFAGGGQWQRLLACLAGFIVSRLVIARMTRTDEARWMSQATVNRSGKEDGHAS